MYMICMQALFRAWLFHINFKALADDKMNVTKKFEFVLGMVENSMGKGENAGCIFSFSHNVFKRPLCQGR